MFRYLAGALAALLLVTGVFFIWQGRAQQPQPLAAPVPAPVLAKPGQALPPIPQAPAADPKDKEEKRFARADKNDDGRITLAELIEPRRKPFAKLDLNGDGRLSFEEWAVKTIDKFEDADADDSKALTAPEFATTAPKRKSKPACACG
ncbi:histidine kinase [Sphingomonas mesophila]|uniref:histidine kinase n=1 Tax=Sphingomonas mesophila TaxID=2303576 RepID=UPI000E57DEBC|nr:histidine kinase [Sphingomonas mesophila]